MSKVVVSGSIAYDYIMKMDDEFSKHILPESLDHLSVGFLMPELERHNGGTTFNIAYSLGLLGMKDNTVMLGSVGKDFEIEGKYNKYINHNFIYKDKDSFTACAYVLNDNKGNQITAFHPGAMMSAEKQSIKNFEGNENIKYLLVSPNAPEAMKKHAREGFEMGLEVFLDPGQALPSFDKYQLLDMAKHSKYLILNEYELNLFKQKTELSQEDLIKMFDKIIVTLGANGTKLLGENIEKTIKCTKIEKAIDPTGAGDAFRSGLMTGLMKGENIEDAIELGSIVASFVVETYGTAEHFFNINDIKEIYRKTYNKELIL